MFICYARILRGLGVLALSMGLYCSQLAIPAARSDDKSLAEDTAGNFVQGLEEGDLPALYETMSQKFKAFMPAARFTQQIGMWRIQTGGPASSLTMAGSMPFSQMPDGTTGSFYYVRFLAAYPNGPLYDDIYLEKVGAAWKVVGFYFFPAPPSQ